MTVLDSETKAPLAFASIYYPDLKTGTVTDSSGNAVILLKQQTILVQISAVGYKTYLTHISSMQDNQTIYLEPSHLEIHEVFISAAHQKLKDENVMNVISMKLPSIQNIMTLPEKLATLPGVSLVSTGVGIGKPVIRGLSGSRIVVYSQGVRVENQQWGDEHGLGLDDSGIESVEIIKGPASLLYGSDALGGVLYFVDERYAQQDGMEGRISSQFSSNTLGFMNSAALKISRKGFHWNISGKYGSHKDYYDGSGLAVPNSRFNTGDLKTAAGFTGRKWTSAIRYNYLHENYGLAELDSAGMAHYSNERGMQAPYQRMQTHLLSAENIVFIKESKLKITGGNVFNKRQEFEEDDKGHPMLEMNLNTSSLDVKWYSSQLSQKWNLVAGSQMLYQVNTSLGQEMLLPDAKTFDIGFFGTFVYHYREHSSMQAGLRFDNRKISSEQNGNLGEEDYKPFFQQNYPAVNFSIGAVYQLKNKLSIRVNLSSGFRAPTTFELLSDGVHEGTFRYEIGDVNLKSENSFQADVSLSYESEHYEFFVNPFVNSILHFIHLQPADSIVDNIPVYFYRQNNAALFGGEGGLHFHPHPLDWLHLEINYSAAFGNDGKGNPLPMLPSQKLNSRLKAEFKVKKILQRFDFYLQHSYSFRQNRVADYETAT
ncbi:MAG TPA: TonB-dependent receptor, partial [Chitinophagales bacterium]|nr:TonB-dependent receptor [Chitinophagales bacterium]